LFAGCWIVLALCFARPLLELIRFALSSELYSYILLIPFVSGYLLWLNRRGLALDSKPVRAYAVPLLVIAGGILVGYRLAVGAGWRASAESYLALMILSLLGFLMSVGFFCLGSETVRRAAFPAALLIFAVPLPAPLLQASVTFLQHGSADVASALFSISGMPFLRHDTSFQLPGMSLEVAPECSGIHYQSDCRLPLLAFTLAPGFPGPRRDPAGLVAQWLPRLHDRTALCPDRAADDSFTDPQAGWPAVFRPFLDPFLYAVTLDVQVGTKKKNSVMVSTLCSLGFSRNWTLQKDI
jgi:exosortase